MRNLEHEYKSKELSKKETRDKSEIRVKEKDNKDSN